MADKDPALPERQVERLTPDFFGTRKQKIRLGICHGKAERKKRRLRRIPCMLYLSAVFFIIAVVKKRCTSAAAVIRLTL